MTMFNFAAEEKPSPIPKHQLREVFVQRLDTLIGDFRRDVGDLKIAAELERRAANLKMADAMSRPVL